MKKKDAKFENPLRTGEKIDHLKECSYFKLETCLMKNCFYSDYYNFFWIDCDFFVHVDCTNDFCVTLIGYGEIGFDDEIDSCVTYFAVIYFFESGCVLNDFSILMTMTTMMMTEMIGNLT